MNTVFRIGLTLPLILAAASPVAAQTCCPSNACLTCPTGQTYRIVYQTVYEQQQHTAYRIEYETVCEQRQVTTYKPVWETAVRENRYTVAKPVVETAVREETYTVQRPVYETAEREETYTVMKPVYETSCRTEYRTVMQPVTTYRTQYVDQGCFAEQMVLKPGLPATRLTWQQPTCAVDPATGQTVYQRGGLYWTQTPRGRYEVQRVWQPNIVAQQIAQTSYVPQTVATQVPVQVCRYVPEQVVRKVPYQVCRMVAEQCVRKVPVTTCRMVYEERVEQIPYKVCRMVAEQQTIQVPRVVEKRIPVTYTCNVPRLVCYRVPLDACGEPIVGSAEVPATTSVEVNAPQPTPAKKAPAGADEKPTLDSGAAAPQPIDGERPAAEELGPMKEVAPPAKESAPPTAYPQKTT